MPKKKKITREKVSAKEQARLEKLVDKIADDCPKDAMVLINTARMMAAQRAPEEAHASYAASALAYALALHMKDAGAKTKDFAFIASSAWKDMDD